MSTDNSLQPLDLAGVHGAPCWADKAPDRWETVSSETGEFARFWERQVDAFDMANGHLTVVTIVREDRADPANLQITCQPAHVALWIGDDPRCTPAEARRIAKALVEAADLLDRS